MTQEQIHQAFEVAKKVYNNEISVTEGGNTLIKSGLKKSVANDYIYAYSKLLKGHLYTRTINAYATDYYLSKILKENGIVALKKALLSLYQHIEYYEATSGYSVRKGRKIYQEYAKHVKKDFAETIFPDEVDPKKKYSEGKTREVKVNSYERNPIARQACIQHYGLNCQVCDFNFEDVFGDLGSNFIHVHHLVEISTIGKEYSVDPINDLIPVCPNCHAMLHKKSPAFTVSELKEFMQVKNKHIN